MYKDATRNEKIRDAAAFKRQASQECARLQESPHGPLR